MSRILLGGAITIMRQERPKLVLTFDTPGTGTGKARIASRWAARRAAKVTSVSDNLSARLVGSGRVSRSESISNGVDTKRFTPEGSHFGLWEQYSFLDGTLLIGQVARIDQNKRQIDLVEALPLQLLRTDLAHSALVFAGNGQNRSAIEQLVASVGNVKIIPRVVDVASFLPELDIFVLCSEDEGAPHAPLESMSCAKAIIVAHVGDMPHILGGGGPRSTKPTRPCWRRPSCALMLQRSSERDLVDWRDSGPCSLSLRNESGGSMPGYTSLSARALQFQRAQMRRK
jgi:glycosyltransferase involved in cell wall biosynthesis